MSERKSDYLIEFGGFSESFGGDCWQDWWFNLLDAACQLIENWDLTSPPKTIKVLLRRDEEDRAEYPWLLVWTIPVTNRTPFFDPDPAEQDAELIFLAAEVLRKAYLDMTKMPPEINPDVY